MVKKRIKKLSNKSMAIIAICAILFGYIAPITDVSAIQIHGEGEYCFTFDMDENGFPVSGVTINGEAWDKNNDHRYLTDDNIYTIVIKAGKKDDQFPWISTAGGLDDYKTYSAVENPNNNPATLGDDYLLTLVLNDMPYDSECANFGISIQDGPFPVYIINREETNVSISISGDELEYHYVEDKPNEADVTYFKFGINSGISDDIVPFTFGNANYTHNDNPAPNNVSRVTTKEAIPYEYDYDGTGYVTFYINGGATDNYTKIEINGIDYSDQAPHNQIDFFEHLMGGALIFEIHGVPYAENYDVVVEGEKTALENRVGGLGWSYLNRKRSGLSEDESEGNFAHGKLEFVSAKYTDIDGVEHEFNSVNEYNNAKFHGTGEIYAWYDGRKDYEEADRREAWGEARVPYGTELTVRIVPDSGYQLVGLAKAPTGFTATDEVGVYKIVLNAENFLYGDEHFDLQPIFSEVGSEVSASSVNIKDGNVDINTAFENGTAKLEVNDVVSMSPERRDSFENKATEEDYEIEYFLDISLYNSVYKGGKKDSDGNYESWDTPIENIDDKARITLELEDDMKGKDLAIIHEKHSGNTIIGYELIDATYNEENNTITFESDSFSNYAIVSKELIDKQRYIVHFESRGGSELPDKEVTAGTTVLEPEEPTNKDFTFDGWYEDETLTTKFDFNTPITGNLTLYAKWVENETEEKDKNYTIKDDGGNSISFKEEDGHEYSLNVIDYLKFSDEDLEKAQIPKEMYDEMLKMISNATKKYGTLISFYEIEVKNEDGYLIHEGPFEIKLKLTDEMKKYDAFKIIYMDIDENITMEEPISLTVDGDYLVGKLKHLSTYALTGSIETSEKKAKAPKTGDDIYNWITISIVSILGLSILKIKKVKNV